MKTILMTFLLLISSYFVHGQNIEDTKTKKTTKLDADAVVLAMGVKSDKGLYEQIKNMKNVYLVGDADKVGRIANATMSAYKCVKNVK